MHSVYTKSLWEARRSYWWWAAALGTLTAMMTMFYPMLAENAEAFQEMMELYPQGFMAMFGIDLESFTTGPGYLTGELYSIMLPVILIIFTVLKAASATAGEEHEGTMDLLIGAPVLRSRVVIDKYAAATVLTAGLGVILIIVLLVTNPIFDLGLGLQGVVAVNLSVVLLALLYGAIALLIGALTGSRGLAAGIAAALAVIAFFSSSLASLVDILEIPQKLSPFYWYIGNEPLANGFSWFHISLLVVATLLFFALAVVAFQHRDVGTHMRTLRQRIGASSE